MNTPHRPGRGSFIARFLSVILGLVTLTVLYGCLGGGGTGSGATGTGNPEETAKIEKSVTLFLTTLQSGNSAQLNALFSPRLQALEGATTFAPLLIRSFGSDMSASADDELFTFFLETSKIVYLSSSQARLPAYTQFTDGQRLQLIFTLSRDSDVWLIDFIEAEMLTESVSLLSEDPVNSSAIWPLGPLNRWLFAETTASTTSSPDEMRFRQLSLSSLKKITTEGLEYYEMADSVYTGTIGKTNAVFGLAPDALEFGKSADSPGFTDAGFFPIYPATASPDLWTLLDPARDGAFQLANALGLWLKTPGAQSSAPWWKLTSLIAVPGAQFTQTVELTDSKGLRQDVELKVMVMRPVLQTLPWVTARAARLDISSRVVHTGETGFATVLFVPGMGPTAYGQYDTSSRRLSRIGYLVEADVNGRAYRSTSTPTPTPELLAVVSTQPLDNATGVASLTPVIVTFDASLEPTSVAGQVTAVASGVFLAGEITASGTQLAFLRPDGWPAGERVDVTIGTGVRSLTGLTLPASYTFGFTVEAVAIPPSAPLITAFSPTTATASGPATLSITGTGFLASATFRLTLAGQTPLMSVVSTNTADLATVTFSLTGVTAGDWLLEIGNTDGGSNIASTPFTITAPPPPAPLVTAVSPTSATNTATILLTVSGDNFYGAPTVRLSHATLATLTAIPSTVTPTSLAVTFDLAGVPSGTRMLTVANPDGQVSSNSIPFSVNDPIPPAIASSYSPLSARGETTTTVTVIGANLAATTSIRLVATGQADIPGTSVTVSGDTYLTATFNLTGAATGSWNLVLFNPGSYDVVASTPFTVAWPLPVLSSVTPTSAPNTGITNLAITGSFFQWGMNSALIGPGGERIDTIYPWNNALNGATFTCSFDLAGKPLQTMSVYLITPDGASNTVPLPFTVRGLASPTVTHIVPDHRPVSYDSGNLTPDLYGSDFVSGAVVQFYVPGATDTPTVYFNSSQNLHVAFTPSATPPATYSVRVINPNGDVATLPGTFLLETPPPLPVITTITPNTVWNDAGNVIFQLDGTDFVATPYVDIEFVYPSRTYSCGVEARNVTFESPTRLSVTLDMSGREPGDWSLRLRNPYGYPANIATITVLASAPAITSITPASGYSNQNVSVTIVGTNLFYQPTISLASTSQPTIPATSVSCSTPTRVDCTFELSSYTPAPGTWDLVYTDFKGQTTTGTFQILAPLP